MVVIKTVLQIPGCMFSSVMQEHACWLVQLLGIGCVDKFAGGNIAQFLKMSYVKVTSPFRPLVRITSLQVMFATDGGIVA